jgi:hypothetical protein
MVFCNNARAAATQRPRAVLSTLTRLQTLDFAGRAVPEASLLLPVLQDLRALRMQDTTHDQLRLLSLFCTRLTRLEFMSGNVANATSCLARLVRLQHLELRKCSVDSDAAAAQLTAALTQLTALSYLDVSLNKFGDGGAHHLARALPMLPLVFFGMHRCGAGFEGIMACNMAYPRVRRCLCCHRLTPFRSNTRTWLCQSALRCAPRGHPQVNLNGRSERVICRCQACLRYASIASLPVTKTRRR